MISLLDTHQHLVYREKASYGWTKDIPLLAEENFILDDYKTLTEGLEIRPIIPLSELSARDFTNRVSC